MRWLNRLEDRLPVWALPWFLIGGTVGFVGAAAALYVVGPRLYALLR